MNYDIFNGDADGIIALLQLRLAEPRNAKLVTGIKRDIALLNRVAAEQGTITKDSKVTVLDVSMEKNAAGLAKALDAGAEVLYVDHHRPGEIPSAANLNAHIDVSADTCTALIVDKLLEGKYHNWAIAAAYGDNLIAVADALATTADLSVEQASQLRELGTLINYNGYGASVEDLHYDPAVLYRELLNYANPLDCIADPKSPYHVLKAAYESDSKNAQQSERVYESELVTVLELPDEAWSRRISGSYGNELANKHPDKAHVILTTIDDAHYLVSLRAPLSNKSGAGDICSEFETGGGRAGAAGINKLPKAELERLIKRVEEYYSK